MAKQDTGFNQTDSVGIAGRNAQVAKGDGLILSNEEESALKRVARNHIMNYHAITDSNNFATHRTYEKGNDHYAKMSGSSGNPLNDAVSGKHNYIPVTLIKKAYNFVQSRYTEPIIPIDTGTSSGRVATKDVISNALSTPNKTLVVHSFRQKHSSETIEDRKQLFDEMLQNKNSSKIIYTSIVPAKSIGYLQNEDVVKKYVVHDHKHKHGAFTYDLVKHNAAANQEYNPEVYTKEDWQDEKTVLLGPRNDIHIQTGYDINNVWTDFIRQNYNDADAREIFETLRANDFEGIGAMHVWHRLLNKSYGTNENRFPKSVTGVGPEWKDKQKEIQQVFLKSGQFGSVSELRDDITTAIKTARRKNQISTGYTEEHALFNDRFLTGRLDPSDIDTNSIKKWVKSNQSIDVISGELPNFTKFEIPLVYFNPETGEISKHSEFVAARTKYFEDTKTKATIENPYYDEIYPNKGDKPIGVMAVINDNNLIQNGTTDEFILTGKSGIKKLMANGPVNKYYPELKRVQDELSKNADSDKSADTVSRYLYEHHTHINKYDEVNLNAGLFPDFVEKVLKPNKMEGWTKNLANEAWGENELLDRGTMKILNHITNVHSNALNYLKLRQSGITYDKYRDDAYDYLAKAIQGNAPTLTRKGLADLISVTEDNMNAMNIKGYAEDSSLTKSSMTPYSQEVQDKIAEALTQRVIPHDFDKYNTPELAKQYIETKIGQGEEWDKLHKIQPHHALDNAESESHDEARKNVNMYDVIEALADKLSASNDKIYGNHLLNNYEAKQSEYLNLNIHDEIISKLLEPIQKNTQIYHESLQNNETKKMNPELLKDFVDWRNSAKEHLEKIETRQKLEEANKVRGDYATHSLLGEGKTNEEKLKSFNKYKTKIIRIYQNMLDFQESMKSKTEEAKGKVGAPVGNKNAEGSHAQYIENERLKDVVATTTEEKEES